MTPQLAPEEVADDRELEGRGSPLYGLQRRSPPGAPESERLLRAGSPGSGSGSPIQGEALGNSTVAGGVVAGAVMAAGDGMPTPACSAPSGAKPSEEVSHRTVEGSTGPLVFAGKRFLEMGGPLFESLQQMIGTHNSKTLSTARDDLFPLPLGDYPGVHPDHTMWLRAVLLGLNSLNGDTRTSTLRPTEVQKSLVQSVMGFVGRMCQFPERVPSSDFSALFAVKGVDYRGEEIKLAKSFTWQSIAGALPQEVGTLELSSFCTGGVGTTSTILSRIFFPKICKLLVAPLESCVLMKAGVTFAMGYVLWGFVKWFLNISCFMWETSHCSMDCFQFLRTNSMMLEWNYIDSS